MNPLMLVKNIFSYNLIVTNFQANLRSIIEQKSRISIKMRNSSYFLVRITCQLY